MPPVASKGKGNKARSTEPHRPVRSRNSTPSSAGIGHSNTLTAYLDISVQDLSTKTKPTYDDILERIGSSTAVPDASVLQQLASDLRALSANCDRRSAAYDRGMRELGQRKKRRSEEDAEKERQKREREEREKLHREAVADEENEERKAALKKKRKDSKAREERPLTHGAHGLAKQDGTDVDMTGSFGFRPIYMDIRN
jgi:transcriptional adapter 3